MVGTLCLLEVRYRELTASYRALTAGHTIQDSPSEVEEELRPFLSPSEVNQKEQLLTKIRGFQLHRL
jgi:hypothetical protein